MLRTARRALRASGLEHNVRIRDLESGWEGVLKVMIDSGVDGGREGRGKVDALTGDGIALGLKVMDPVERARCDFMHHSLNSWPSA